MFAELRVQICDALRKSIHRRPRERGDPYAVKIEM